MDLSEKNRIYLTAMSLVEALSARLGVTSYIWGGFTLDIYQGHLLREHQDLDYLTENLHTLIPQLSALFVAQGWQPEKLANGDLRVTKSGFKIHLGHLELAIEAKWSHNGEKGYLCFPRAWLQPEPVQFYNVKLHVIAPEFEYVLKKHPQLLNPSWEPREVDIFAGEKLSEILEKKGVDLDDLYTQVTAWTLVD
ncbi:MAG: hypothetical protein JW953_23940 [Anaerolineae bacterium]|nr:hypothetical protein [Anaerolineae bacterium]